MFNYVRFTVCIYAWKIVLHIYGARDGTPVTDFSWACPDAGSCWSKFHNFYLPKQLFNRKRIDINQKKIKFGAVVLTSELYQKKYDALGIDVQKRGNKTTELGNIQQELHMIRYK